MFDSVLHTDRIISAFTTGDDYAEIFTRHGVLPTNYHGPSAIHTLILDACAKKGLPGASLWCHCPAYLQGIVHHGMLIQLTRVLADMLVGFPGDPKAGIVMEGFGNPDSGADRRQPQTRGASWIGFARKNARESCKIWKKKKRSRPM